MQQDLHEDEQPFQSRQRIGDELTSAVESRRMARSVLAEVKVMSLLLRASFLIST